MKRFTALVALLCATALIAACGSNDHGGSGDNATVKVGLLYPLSGAVATAGVNALHGAQLGAAVLNGAYPQLDVPRLTKMRLKLVTADTQGDPQVGSAAVSRLVQSDGVQAIVGAYQSAVSITASRRAEVLQVPFVNGDSAANGLSDQGLRWWFRTGPQSSDGVAAYLAWLQTIASEHPVKRVSIIHDNDDAGNDFATEAKKAIEAQGVKVVDEISFEPNATDLSSQVQKLAAGKPDAVFAQMFINDTALFLKTMAQLRYTPPALLAFGGGWDDPSFARVAGKLGTQNIRAVSWSSIVDATNPLAKQVDEIFTKRYGTPLNGDSARTFTAMLTLGQAIEQARSGDPEKVREALRGLDVTKTIMPWKGVKFDQRGQNTEAGYLIVQLDAKGVWQGLYPAGVATAKVVWPMPSLDGR